MISWIVTCGNIVNEPADVLICSANVFLNLSGGVGGELLLRYGPQMQQELHQYLAKRGIRHVSRGEVIVTSSCGTTFRKVLHAVAVDGAYQSSSGVVQNIVARSLEISASLGAKRVALTALATGFGRLTLRQFGEGVLPLLAANFPPIEEVVICVRHESDRDELLRVLKNDRSL